MTKPLTKTELIAELADKMETDRKSAAAALDALSAVILEQVAAGGGVTIPDVGKIACRDRPERMVRNSATGAQLKKPADRQVKMRIAKRLKDSANG
ncbi:HU family DNA-binding protein [uncultured Jannaschia sp.]|uniref:HU family DNA-binding protein n=1 Tax=uncultured Jannaschia sp. TaxID=293347 RepID=UPI002623B2FE|nr:HU family DNA-binding protein [uncultured Jannaschia sp.]